MKVSIHVAAETLISFQREILCLVKNAADYNKLGACIVNVTIYEWENPKSKKMYLRIQHTCANNHGVEILSSIFVKIFESTIKTGGIQIIETESCVSVDFAK